MSVWRWFWWWFERLAMGIGCVWWDCVIFFFECLDQGHASIYELADAGQVVRVQLLVLNRLVCSGVWRWFWWWFERLAMGIGCVWRQCVIFLGSESEAL
jgi:hypothetical protein